ncbi:MAG: hypothetical protein VKJ04_04875 [Vampirovibrionales bacterium]|nr:hypothetical protein [Vampirovibrionales bacterium]
MINTSALGVRPSNTLSVPSQTANISSANTLAGLSSASSPALADSFSLQSPQTLQVPTANQSFSLSSLLQGWFNWPPNNNNGDAAATQKLQQPAFAATDVNQFTPQAFPSASPMTPAAPKPTNEGQLLLDASKTMLKRGVVDTAKAAATYVDPSVRQVVPDPRLRTALALLQGTAAEGGISSVKNGDYASIRFSPFPNETGSAVVVTEVGQTKPTILVNERYQYEDPRILSQLLSNEFTHSDQNIGQREELISSVISSSVYAQFVKEDPSLAQSGTELTRRTNTQLMALLNSRDAEGDIRLLTSSGNVYPNGNPLANFGAAFNIQSGPDTPGNAYIRQTLANLTGQSFSGANFNLNTINNVDQHIDNAFSPSEWVAVANALKLQT